MIIYGHLFLGFEKVNCIQRCSFRYTCTTGAFLAVTTLCSIRRLDIDSTILILVFIRKFE